MSLTTTNEKGLAATNDQAPENTTNAAIVGQAGAERKEFATAAARAAQAGCTLHELASGGYLLGRWTMCRELPDLRAVHALLARMTGVQ